MPFSFEEIIEHLSACAASAIRKDQLNRRSRDHGRRLMFGCRTRRPRLPT
jgi:hypothetical protein